MGIIMDMGIFFPDHLVEKLNLDQYDVEATEDGWCVPYVEGKDPDKVMEKLLLLKSMGSPAANRVADYIEFLNKHPNVFLQALMRYALLSTLDEWGSCLFIKDHFVDPAVEDFVSATDLSENSKGFSAIRNYRLAARKLEDMVDVGHEDLDQVVTVADVKRAFEQDARAFSGLTSIRWKPLKASEKAWNYLHLAMGELLSSMSIEAGSILEYRGKSTDTEGIKRNIFEIVSNSSQAQYLSSKINRPATLHTLEVAEIRFRSAIGTLVRGIVQISEEGE